MKTLTNSTFAQTIASGVVVVDFFAERCGPCKMLAPYLEQMETQLNGAATFYKVDVDSEQQLSMAQGITAMPTIKVFKDGVEFRMIRGADAQGIWTAINDAIKTSSAQVGAGAVAGM
jgi:thioredoxin 1